MIKQITQAMIILNISSCKRASVVSHMCRIARLTDTGKKAWHVDKIVWKRPCEKCEIDCIENMDWEKDLLSPLWRNIPASYVKPISLTIAFGANQR